MDISEQITLEMTQICMQILQDSRREIYLRMRYLDLALSALRPQITTELAGIGTDGYVLFAHPKILADLYERDRRLVNRLWLHTVYHCLFRHLTRRGSRDEALWDLACDMCVEFLIDDSWSRPVRTGRSRLRMNWQDELKKECRVLNADRIYRALAAKDLDEAGMARLREEFSPDDHSLWPRGDGGDDPPPEASALEEKWQDISEKTQTEMETFSKESAQGAGDLHEMVSAQNRERMDLKTFLRKFAVLREEVRIDPDSFDYVFYTYGLSLYGNLPLIEPQEQREVYRIDEFVIVLDVSMSTAGPLVRSFLEQAYAVLSQEETWTRKIHVRVLQCDERVLSDRKITSSEELKAYMEQVELLGGGGTDFRPAFDYVQGLIEKGELPHLRGLIYFTDGRGTYPRKSPPYDTAFVFLEEDYTDAQVPPWAMKLILEREDLEEETEGLRPDISFVWPENAK